MDLGAKSRRITHNMKEKNMRQKGKILIGALAVFIYLLVSNAWSTIPEFGSRFDLSLEPISPFETNKPVTFQLNYKLKQGYEKQAGEIGDVSIYFIPSGTADTLAQFYWPVKYDKTYSNSLKFDLTIPDGNVFLLIINIQCGQAGYDGGYYIASTGKSIQITQNHKEIENLPGTRHINQNNPINLRYEDLTPAQRQIVFKFIVDLTTPDKRKFVENLVGPFPDSPDSCVDNVKYQSYYIETTMGTAIRIAYEGIMIDFADQQPHWKYSEETGKYEMIKDTSK